MPSLTAPVVSPVPIDIFPVVTAPPTEMLPVVTPVFHSAAVPVVVKDVFIVSIVGVVMVGEDEVIIVPEDGRVAPLIDVTPGSDVTLLDPAFIAIA